MAHAPPRLPLLLLHHELAIARLSPDAPFPPWATRSAFLSAIVRTPEELSVLTTAEHVPADAQAERGYRALKVRGPLPFHLAGILASVAQPLAEAGIPILPLATYDTDYVLVKHADVARTLDVLRAAGHRVEEEPLPVRAGDLDAGTPHVGT